MVGFVRTKFGMKMRRWSMLFAVLTVIMGVGFMLSLTTKYESYTTVGNAKPDTPTTGGYSNDTATKGPAPSPSPRPTGGNEPPESQVLEESDGSMTGRIPKGGVERPDSTKLPPAIVNEKSDWSLLVTIGTAAGSIISAIATVSTMLLAWRKDRRETQDLMLRLAALEQRQGN